MANPQFFKQAFDELAVNGVLGNPTGDTAYAYLRVSSAGQADESRSGLPRQIKNVHEVASTQGLKIPWDLVFADDHSGFELDGRPELSRLRQEYQSPARRASAVVVENLDRLSRNADWHQGFLLDEMRKFGVKCVFWKSFSSRIERAVIGAIAQDGMEDAKRRMVEGNIYKAKSGRVTARTRAFGYIFVDSKGDPTGSTRKDTHYAPHPDEAPIIRLIFEKVGLEGWSTRKLAAYFEDRYPPPGKYKYWEPSQIGLFIRSTLYKGEFVSRQYKWVKVPAERLHPGDPIEFVKKRIERPREEWIIVSVPPLVSPELWELANQMLSKNQVTSRRNAKEPYLLTGLVKCATCGYTFTGYRSTRSKQNKSCYRCAGRNNGPLKLRLKIGCNQSQIKLEWLDDAVWSCVCQLLLQPQRLIEHLDEQHQQDRNHQIYEQIEYIDKQIAGKGDEDDKLYRAYMAGAFGEVEYAERRKMLETQTQLLRDEVKKLREQVLSDEQVEQTKNLIYAIAESALDSQLGLDAPFAVRKQVIRLVVDRITLNVNEGWFELHGVIGGRFLLDGTIVSSPACMDSWQR